MKGVVGYKGNKNRKHKTKEYDKRKQDVIRKGYTKSLALLSRACPALIKEGTVEVEEVEEVEEITSEQ